MCKEESEYNIVILSFVNTAARKYKQSINE